MSGLEVGSGTDELSNVIEGLMSQLYNTNSATRVRLLINRWLVRRRDRRAMHFQNQSILQKLQASDFCP
jgi:hypothetical protein